MKMFGLELQVLWNIENKLVQILPGMLKKATDLGLIKSLSHHLAETVQHKTAIEAICKQLEVSPQKKVIEILENILSQNERTLAGNKDTHGINESIIEGAQKIEQYEISAYQPAIDLAGQLNLEGIQKRLLLTWEEERQASNKLNFLLKNLSVTHSDMVEGNFSDADRG